MNINIRESLSKLNKSELVNMIYAQQGIELRRNIPDEEIIECVINCTSPGEEYCDPLKSIRESIMAFMREQFNSMATSCDKDCTKCPPIKVVECWVTNEKQFK